MTIFSQELKSSLAKLITWTLVLAVFVGLITAFYPMIVKENMALLIQGFIENLRDTLQVALGLNLNDNFDFENLSYYLGLTYQFLSFLTAVFAIQIGAKALSKEQESGNIQYIYSNPISRSEIVTQKFLASLLVYVIFLILLALGSFGIAYAFKLESTNIMDLLTSIGLIYAGLLGSGLVYLSLGYFVSSFMRNATHAETIGVILTILSVIGIVILNINAQANVENSMISLGIFLPLAAFNPLRLVQYNFDIVAMAANIIYIIVFLALTYVVYGSKDLKY